ncbi:hypothetical protein sos41_31400 [Alphaproteobacteria bacterium SO-S41]|nr:hypothetical protein sos41_31400 [Alphaproteobacteria bacterium SO-S41]
MAPRTPKAKTPPPKLGEVTAGNTASDIGAAYVSALETLKPEDPLLAARGGDLKLYEEVMRDPQVKSCFQQRQLAVVSREWKVDAGGDAPIDKLAAEHLEAQLKAIGFDRATVKMLYGVFYGFAVGEILWKVGDDGLYAIDKIKVRRARRFAWGKDLQLRLITKTSPQGELLPDRKFWTFTAGAEHDDDPYGRGLGYWLYWPVFFARNGTKFWAKFLERFGAPTVKGTYPRNVGDAEIRKLLQALRAFQESAAIALPEGMTAELVEAAKSGADQARFIDQQEASISKIILSQTMTTDDGSSRAQGQVHFDVRQEVAKSDADLVCEAFNEGPARWLTEWNFPGAAVPRVYRDFEEAEDLDKVVERDKKLMDMGFEPDDEYIQETYGKHWTRKPPPETPPALVGQPGTPQPLAPDGKVVPLRRPAVEAFAEAHVDADAIDEGAATMLSEWEQLVAPIASQLDAAAAGADGYDAFVANVLALVPTMDVTALTEALARAGFQARAGGLAGDALSDAENA